MSEHAAVGTRPADPLVASALKAWGRLQPDRGGVGRIDLLKRKKAEPGKKSIYRLAGAGPGGSAVIAKRCRLAKARLEQTVYEEVLPRLPLPALRCHGLVEEPDSQLAWLFLEDAGEDRYSPSLPGHRRLAARWLGALHTAAARVAPADRLPDRGPAHYLGQVRSARDRILANLTNPALKAEDRALLKALLCRCEDLEACWGRVEEACAGMPRTLVHGDFVGKNLRTRPGGAGPVLLAFDWACAGWGVPAVDLTPLSCPRFSGNPDLAAYAAVLREHWPGCGLATVRQWANLATLLRSLAALNWEVANLRHEWVEGSMARLRFYRDAIAGVVQAAGWGR
jgi:hypothetical protein